MAIYASLNDRGHLLSIESIPDTTRIDIIYEMLARLLILSKVERVSRQSWLTSARGCQLAGQALLRQVYIAQ